MHTIRGRLLRAFFGVIVALSFASLLFLILNLWVIEQYRSVSETMIAEYQLVDSTFVLIDAFNRRVQSAGAVGVAEREQKRIDDAELRIQELTAFLDTKELDVQSKSDYLGFKAGVEKFTTHINDSLRRFEETSIKDYFSDYNEANKQYGFMRENGTALIFSQLKHAAFIRDQINQTYFISIVLGLGALVVLVILCISFVFRFANRLSTPLRALSVVAEKIAGGDMTATIGDNLLKTRDEIGSLATSYKTMIGKLFENITKLDLSNKEIAESAHALETKNSELERLNKLMVDRELKMIELKKANEALRIQLKSKL